jgi:protein-S-isoprenylcysteine O-methyltransferase Ste14
MLKILRADNGMNIIGQGMKIMLFAAPFAAVAVWLAMRMPDVVRIPGPGNFRTIAGLIFLVPGLALWLSAVMQLLIGFPQGKLVTSGAYGICRNPIYSSFALFTIPGLSLIFGTWSYLLISVALYLGVVILIRKEEEQLTHIFGDQYRVYKSKVHRMIPFMKGDSIQ